MDDYNPSLRSRRPILNNQQNFANYENEDEFDQENDGFEDRYDEEEDEFDNGYYRVSGNDAESSQRPKKRKLENLGGGYEFAQRGGANLSTEMADWSEDATFMLLEVWGDKYVELGRKSLRSEDWAEVAERVSDMCKMKISDGQCRNRLETLKQKYRKEKAKMGEMGMGGGYFGKWVFFKKMDMLLSLKKPHSGLPCGVDAGEYVFMNPRVYLERSNALDEMRDSPGESESEGEEEDVGKEEDDEGFRMLAESVQNFSEIYEKIESSKRQQMMELEKMRMDFQMELELQKKQIQERAQAEIAKIRRGGGDDDTDVSVENVSG